MQGTSGVVRLTTRLGTRANKLRLEIWDREGQWEEADLVS